MNEFDRTEFFLYVSPIFVMTKSHKVIDLSDDIKKHLKGLINSKDLSKNVGNMINRAVRSI